MITRQVRETESAATMTLYTLFVFITVSVVIGLALGHGRFDGYAHESLTFLLRAWHWPELSDMWVFGLIGVASMAGGMFVSQAFRLSDAAFIAPMEYVAMPLALFWGVVVFDTWPDGLALFGMVLIVGSGLFLVFREAQIARRENI
jgi:drug/metabolite transporter (DMT)-like permease